jgi:histidine triad (HIT) family protein
MDRSPMLYNVEHVSLQMNMKALYIHFVSRLSRMAYSMSGDCIFCKIVANEVRAAVVYNDDQVTAFRDIHPVAPTHILIVPNRHIESVGALEPGDEPLIGHLFGVARRLAEEEGIARSGFRLITNTGADGGQTVFHLHVHLIGGQRMRYPMG